MSLRNARAWRYNLLCRRLCWSVGSPLSPSPSQPLVLWWPEGARGDGPSPRHSGGVVSCPQIATQLQAGRTWCHLSVGVPVHPFSSPEPERIASNTGLCCKSSNGAHWHTGQSRLFGFGHMSSWRKSTGTEDVPQCPLALPIRCAVPFSMQVGKPTPLYRRYLCR
jgi:hypothetical protein